MINAATGSYMSGFMIRDGLVILGGIVLLNYSRLKMPQPLPDREVTQGA
jgi:hypothetical protein